MTKMSKFYSKLTYGFVASAALLCSSGAFAQVCDPTSVGDYTEAVNADGDSWYTIDIQDDFGDIIKGIDPNSGFGFKDATTGEQYPNRFTELGTHGVGETIRVNGFTGNFNSTDPFSPTLPLDKRDLDYLHIKLTTACYLQIQLSMSDVNGDPVGANEFTSSLLQFYRWADPVGDPYGDKAGDGSPGNDYFYGDYGFECPQTVLYVLPNGDDQPRFSVPAGDIIFTVWCPFDSGNRALVGPMAWGLNIDISGYDYAKCGSTAATNDCITVSNKGGCSDGLCCDTVCNGGFAACCDTAWDTSCLQHGVDLCGNFIYSCANPSTSASNDCVGSATAVNTFPTTIAFDNTSATQDGPNDVTRLCTSQMKHDLWYIVGPVAANGEITVSMCGLGNPIATDTNGDGEIDDFPADSVINVFYLGTDPTVPNPQDLPNLYIGCSDDNCTDSGAIDPVSGLPTVDVGGSSSVRVTGVEAGHYVLIAVGQYEPVTADPTTTSPEGFAASMTIDFAPVFVDNGLQTYAIVDGGGVNQGLISGWSTVDLPKRMIFVPFEMTTVGTITNFNFAGGGGPGPDEGLPQPNLIHYKIIARDTNGGAYGEFGRPFGDGNYNASQVLFEGSEAYNVDDYYDIGDQCSVGCGRYYVDITNPFVLQPGSYYFTIYGADADGENTYLSWLMYGVKSMPQVTTAAVDIPVGDSGNLSLAGPFAANTPFGWRSIGTGPKFCFYNLGPTYTSRPDLPAGILYGCAFNMGGSLNTAPPCPTDLNSDGVTDSSDMGAVLGSFGPCDLGTPGDFNDDLVIDSSDLGTTLGNFGACPTE
jgi:hypothetical protein